MLSLPRRYLYDDGDDYLPIVTRMANPLMANRGLLDLYNEIDRLSDHFGNFDEMIAKPLIKDGKFQADFDLRNFDPNGIQVKMDGNTLCVNAKQEKKGDGHYEYREFVRKVAVPKEVAEDQLKCKLDKDGRLRIEAPVKKLAIEQKERDIPIEMINQK